MENTLGKKIQVKLIYGFFDSLYLLNVPKTGSTVFQSGEKL